MSEKRWVQHISGQGEKWKVWDEKGRPSWMAEHRAPDDDTEWCVYGHKSDVPAHLLPKSEYRLCDPPEEWEECTREVIANDVSQWREICLGARKRFAWKGDALIIERRKS